MAVEPPGWNYMPSAEPSSSGGDWQKAWEEVLETIGQKAESASQSYIEGAFEGLRDFGDFIELKSGFSSPFDHIWNSLKEAVYDPQYNPKRVVFEVSQLKHAIQHLPYDLFNPNDLIRQNVDTAPSPLGGTLLQLGEFCRVNMHPQVEGMMHVLSSMKSYYQSHFPPGDKETFGAMWKNLTHKVQTPEEMSGDIDNLSNFLNQLKWN